MRPRKAENHLAEKLFPTEAVSISHTLFFVKFKYHRRPKPALSLLILYILRMLLLESKNLAYLKKDIFFLLLLSTGKIRRPPVAYRPASQAAAPSVQGFLDTRAKGHAAGQQPAGPLGLPGRAFCSLRSQVDSLFKGFCGRLSIASP